MESCFHGQHSIRITQEHICFKRCSFMDEVIFMTYIRPHLEYAIQSRNPYTKKDRKTLEKLQRRATKVPRLLRHLLRDDLRISTCTALEVIRERCDLIKLYKIESGMNQVNWVYQIKRGAPRRGEREHIRKEIVANCQQRNKFFTNRVVNDWNSPPDEVYGALTTNSFKNKLEKVQQSYYSSHSTDSYLNKTSKSKFSKTTQTNLSDRVAVDLRFRLYM